MNDLKRKPPAFTEGTSQTDCGLPTSFSLPLCPKISQSKFAVEADPAADAHKEMRAGAEMPSPGWGIADALDGAALLFALAVIGLWGYL